MHYVKQFNINGVDTKQVACIELQGKPNSATEGSVGVLGIDVTSPTNDVYKCVAVNGAIYTWELLSSGMSIISSTETGEGFKVVNFEYSKLLIPNGYILKPGDLILDRGGYLYFVSKLGSSFCEAYYTGTQFGVSRDEPGVAPAIRTINDALLKFFVGTLEEYKALPDEQKQNLFAIITDDDAKERIERAIEEKYKELADGSVAVAKAKVVETEQKTVTLVHKVGELGCNGTVELDANSTYVFTSPSSDENVFLSFVLNVVNNKSTVANCHTRFEGYVFTYNPQTKNLNCVADIIRDNTYISFDSMVLTYAKIANLTEQGAQ